MSVLAPVIGPLRQGLGLLLDGLLPPLCLHCAAAADRPGSLCASCWAQVRFIGPPQCTACGLPFEFDPGGSDALCGACSRERPPYRQARSAFVYEGVGRSLVLGFKLSDRTYAAPAFAAWMARSGAPSIESVELIVPVPLSRRQLFLRRFNQAALLAQALGRCTGRPVAPDLLVRTRTTARQSSLSASERARNVRGAFAVRRGREERLAGKAVLLIDDVLTTGATAAACATALFAAGAREVDVLTLARTVRATP